MKCILQMKILDLNKCSAVVQQVECVTMGCGHLLLLLGCTIFPTDFLEIGSMVHAASWELPLLMIL